MRRSALFVAFSLLAAAPSRAWVITETPLTAANSGPNFIIQGPAGNMWFTEYNADKIGVVDGHDGTLLHEYPTTSSPCGPIGITLGADGNIWYTCTKAGHGAIAKMDASGSNGVSYASTGQPAGPIVAGTDGWLYYSRADGALEVADTSGSSFASHTVSGSTFGLAAGGDGYAWIASPGDTNIWRMRFTGTEAAPAWDTAHIAGGESVAPYTLTWCQQFGGIYWVSYAADQVIKETFTDSIYSPKSTGVGSSPEGIACTADGNGWFAASGGNYIGRFDDTSVHYAVPTASALPYQLAIGGDGSIWFTENAGNKIGRLRLRAPGDVNGDDSVDVGDVFYLINFLFAGGPWPKS